MNPFFRCLSARTPVFQMSSYMNTPAFADERSPAYGNFDALNLRKWDKEMIQSGFQAVESVDGGWEFLRTYEPPQDKGFMFTLPTGKMLDINAAIENRYPGHSGASYGCTMRALQYIAKVGWDAYAKEMLEKYGPPPPPQDVNAAARSEFQQFLDAISPSTKDCKPDTTLTMEQKREKFLALPTDMTLDEQAKALRELGDVPMTYFEMRSRFG